MRYGRIFVSLSILCLAQAVGAAVLPVSVSKSFYNDHWFPLNKKDMEEAAIDTALDQISANGLLAFVAKGKGKGNLDLRVTLVEPAQLVKLTIELNAEGYPSAVATASTSLEELDYDGIYYAFEHVGREAADRLSAKLTSISGIQEKSAAPPLSKLPSRRVKSVRRESTALAADNCNDALLKKLTSGERSGWPSKAIYQRGQQLKENHCYFDARVAFEIAAGDSNPANSSWRQLAENELVYGLPIFEARQLSLGISKLIQDESKGWDDISAHLKRIEQLYRQILVENESNVERVIAAQSELDNFHVSSQALHNSLSFNSQANVENLKRALLQDLAMRGGELPANAEDLKLRLGSALHGFKILRFESIRREGAGRLRVRHKRLGTDFDIVFNTDFDVQVNQRR